MSLLLLLSHSDPTIGSLELFISAYNSAMQNLYNLPSHTAHLLDVSWNSVYPYIIESINVMSSISIQEWSEMILACYVYFVTQGSTF